MTQVLETTVCNTTPGVLMLSTFVSMSGNPMIAVTFVNTQGVVGLRETVIHTEINERHMREFYNDNVAKYAA